MSATIFAGGRVFTAEVDGREAECVVVDGDRFVYVGNAAEAEQRYPDASRVDLRGRMLMPGIHDAHTHLLVSGLKYGDEARVEAHAHPDEIVKQLQAANCCHRGDGWIVAGEAFLGPTDQPGLTREHLDKAFGETPVYVHDYTAHHAIVNTAALKRAGIAEGAVHEHGGEYRVDHAGRHTGQLLEHATWPVQHAIPRRPDTVYQEAVRWAQSVCHRYGITSVQEASASRIELEALTALEQSGELSLRVAAHIVWGDEGFGMDTAEELDKLIAASAEWDSPFVDASFVKVWLDGTPLPTAPTHAPLREDGSVVEDWLFVTPKKLTEVLMELDEAGKSVKIHCAGEGAVRVCLDAIERVRARQATGVPHEIAHAGFVADEDYSRFAQLNVTAEMSPALWHVPESGLQGGFHFSRMRDAGARMTIGSDWIVTPNPNLFPGLQGAIEHPVSPISLFEALAAVTRIGAEAVGADHRRGTVTVGKDADFVILDRDLLEIQTSEIGATVVEATYVAGILRYKRENA